MIRILSEVGIVVAIIIFINFLLHCKKYKILTYKKYLIIFNFF